MQALPNSQALSLVGRQFAPVYTFYSLYNPITVRADYGYGATKAILLLLTVIPASGGPKAAACACNVEINHHVVEVRAAARDSALAEYLRRDLVVESIRQITRWAHIKSGTLRESA